MTSNNCTVEGCEKPKRTAGLCNKHYLRSWRTGTTDKRIFRKGNCTVEDCEDRELAKGLCGKHYQRLRKTGTTYQDSTQYEWLQNFVKTVTPTEDDCIPWPFCFNTGGYGQTSYKGVNVSAYRFVCEHFNGPSTLQAAHDCGNRACINPLHLRWSTAKENSEDRLKHGTLGLKLTEHEARAIFNATGSNREISEKYGCTVDTASAIRRKKTWKLLHEQK